MQNSNYETPVMEMLTVVAELGFAASAENSTVPDLNEQPTDSEDI